MKILLFIDSLGSGGAQRQLVGLAHLLKNTNRHKLKVITYFDFPFYEEFLRKNQVDYEFISQASNKYSRLFYIYRYFIKFKPDIVVSYLDTPNIIASFIRFIGINFKLVVSERNTTQVLNIKGRLKFFLYRFADVIVPNSFTQRNYIIDHYPCLSKKIKTITNFVDVDYFQPVKQLNNPKKILKILVVARFEPQKNTLFLLEAINQLVNKNKYCIKVNWYGNNFFNNGLPTKKSNYFLEVKSKIKSLGLDNNFKLHQQTNNILTAYQETDIFCLPSLYEGFPNVICEAMSCGKPILASDVCDNSHLVTNDVNGYLFDPYNLDSFIKAISNYYLSRNKIYEHGKQSRLISLEKFTKEQFLENYLQIIN